MRSRKGNSNKTNRSGHVADTNQLGQDLTSEITEQRTTLEATIDEKSQYLEENGAGTELA